MPISRKLLVLVLALSVVFELLIAASVILWPEIEAQQFHIAILPDTLSLAYLLAEFAVFLASICGLAAWQLKKGQRSGAHLSMICGLFWMGFGIELFFRYYEPRFLLLDSARGLLILLLAWRVDKNIAP